VVGVGGPPQATRLDQIPMETVLEAWSALALRPAAGAALPAAAAALRA
jgi:hypothetical protein